MTSPNPFFPSQTVRRPFGIRDLLGVVKSVSGKWCRVTWSVEYDFEVTQTHSYSELVAVLPNEEWQ